MTAQSASAGDDPPRRACLKARVLCPRHICWGLLVGLWLLCGSPALAQGDSFEGPIAVLPVEGVDGVSERHVERLQEVYDDTQAKLSADDMPLTLPDSVVEGCRGERRCLLDAAQQLGATRVLETRLSASGDRLQVETGLVDAQRGELLTEPRRTEMPRYRLRSLGADMFGEVLNSARNPVVEEAEPQRPAAARPVAPRSASRSESEHDAWRQVDRAVGSRTGARALSDHRPRRERKRGEKSAPIPGTQTGEAYLAKRAAYERDPKRFRLAEQRAGAEEDEARGWLGRLAEIRSDARRGESDGKGRLMGVYLGLAALSFFVGYYAMSILPAFGRVARRQLARANPGGVKQQSENLSLLRACCKQLTPGLIMSTEFETVRHFHFALLDGKELSIHVTDYQETDRSAFRPGAMLCVQFSHERRACIGMVVVKKARRVRGKMRVQLQVPEHLADIVLPRRFAVPVANNAGLVGQVVMEEGDRKLSFVSRVVELSSETLCLKVDSDTPELPTSCTVKISLRSKGERADINAKYEGTEDGKLILRVLPELGGRQPSRAYADLFKKIEAAWVAPAA